MGEGSERSSASLRSALTPLAALLRRELLERVRTGGHFAMRTVYVVVLLAIVVLVASEAFTGFGNTITRAPGMGRTLFQTFSVVQYTLVVLIIPLVGAGAVVEERNDRSLGLLLLTELSYGQITLGKVLARLGVVTLIVLSNLPVLSLASMLGGVELVDMIRVFVLTLATAGAFLGVTVFISAWASTTVRVAVTSYLVLILFMVSLFGMLELDPSLYVYWHPVVTMATALFEPLSLGSAWWISALVNLGVGLVFTALAALVLRLKVVRRSSSSGDMSRSTSASVKPSRVWRNPIAWREWALRGKMVRWLVVSLTVGVALACLLMLADGDDEVSASVLVGLSVIAFMFFVFTLSVGSSAFAQEKREQTLELINLTFMSPWSIVLGKQVAIVRLWLYSIPMVTPPLVVGLLTSDDFHPLGVVVPQVTLLVLMLFFGAMATFFSLVADSPLKAALPAIGTFLYISLPIVWWPLLMFKGMDDAIGVSLAMGYLVVWAPMLVLVARTSPARGFVGFALVGFWSAAVIFFPLLTEPEVLFLALNPFAVEVGGALLLVGRDLESEMIIGVISGVFYFGSAAAIFIWASAHRLEAQRSEGGGTAENPAVAATLSAFIPGTGQIYVSRALRGALFIVGYVALVGVVIVLSLAFSPVAVLLLLVGHVAAAVDAWRVARSGQQARHSEVVAARRAAVPTPEPATRPPVDAASPTPVDEVEPVRYEPALGTEAPAPDAPAPPDEDEGGDETEESAPPVGGGEGG